MTRVLQQLRSASRRSGDEAGFTMVEMMMAIFIFGLVITGLAVGMASSLNLTRQNRNRSIAANLASQQMDTVRSMDFDDLNNVTQQAQPTTSSTSVDGVPYSFSQYTRWVYKSETGATPGPCQAPPSTANPLAYISVVTSVSWNDMRGVPPVTSSTVVTPPVGIYDQTDGHIAVTVLTRDGAPAPGVTASIASTGVSDAAITSSDGCAFFAFEPIGTYVVTLSGTGMVDGQGLSAPPQTVTVKAGSTSNVQFQYDVASSLVLTLQGNGGYAVPNAVPIALGNTHLVPLGVMPATGSGNPRTITGLFPYADGYQPWAGLCSDADPIGVSPSGPAYYPGATRPAAIVMTPGQSSSGTVQLPALRVTVMKGASLKSGYAVTATHVVPSGVSSDPGCPTAEAYALGTSNASGLVSMALPYGTWKITATSGASTGNANVTLSPLNANNPAALTVTVS